MGLFEPVLVALDRVDVRCVIVGGVATVLHGYARLTADLDLAIDLTPDRPMRAIEALLELGLLPRLPVDARDFADPDVRRTWIDQRNLRVFSMYDRANPLLQVDLFAEGPIPFEDLWLRSVEVELSTVSARIACIDDLISMKRTAGRPQDLADVEALELIQRGEADR